MEKVYFTIIMVAILIAGMSGNAIAQLIDRGNGFIYDQDLDITYYDFTFGPTNFSGASNWANNLAVGGFTDWRLTKMNSVVPNFTQTCFVKTFDDVSGAPDRGWNKSSSELGHLYYDELNGVALRTETAACVTSNDPFGLLGGTGPFQNLPETLGVWMSTPEFGGAHHWNFGLGNGGQGTADNGAGLWAIAVRDGDVGPSVAQLIDRGNGFIYDQDLDITYYDFTFGPTNFSGASNWANNLAVGGFTDWRLTKMNSVVPNFTQTCFVKTFDDVSGAPDRGWNKSSSELGHLYYDELNGVALRTETAACVTSNDPFGLLGGTGPFQNLPETLGVWMSTPEFGGAHHWNFGLGNGGQGTADNGAGLWAIAVRDGDVGPQLLPAVEDALTEAGLAIADVPPSVLALLTDAAENLLLSTVVGTLADNVLLAPGEAVVVAAGGTVEGNISGETSNAVVLGNDSTVKGNIEGVGVVFTGFAEVDGNLFDTATELSIAPEAMVSFNGDVDVAILDIGEDGGAAINGNLAFVGSELNMASGATLGVNGNIICSESMTVDVDATATIMLGGNNECPALEGKGGLP